MSPFPAQRMYHFYFKYPIIIKFVHVSFILSLLSYVSIYLIHVGPKNDNNVSIWILKRKWKSHVFVKWQYPRQFQSMEYILPPCVCFWPLYLFSLTSGNCWLSLSFLLLFIGQIKATFPTYSVCIYLLQPFLSNTMYGTIWIYSYILTFNIYQWLNIESS